MLKRFTETPGVLVVAIVSCLLFAHGGTLADDKRKRKKIEPTPAEIAFGLRMQGKADAAHEELLEAMKDHEGHHKGWFELARIEFYRAAKTQNMGRAFEFIGLARGLAPDEPRYAYWAGLIRSYDFVLLVHRKQTNLLATRMRETVADLERALELDPNHIEARKLLVSCYGNNPTEHGGDPKKAKAHATYLERLSPTWGAWATCELETRDPKKRAQLWRETAEAEDDSAAAQTQYATAAIRAGDTEAGLKALEQALQLDPKDRTPLLEAAIALALAGKPGESEKVLYRYLKLSPPAPLEAWATMALGRVLVMQKQDDAGKKAKAKELQERARRVDPLCWSTMRPPPRALFLP